MANEAKEAAVKEISGKFRDSSAAVITEYRGLSVTQMTELRRSLGAETDYTVAKNTLVKRAAADADVEGLDDLFVGPTAIAFVGGEPVDAAKALRDFAKDNEALVIKGAYVDGAAVGPEHVTKLASLESRETLLSRFAGDMKGSLSKAASMFNQLPTQVARVAAALQEKGGAAGAGSASPDAASDSGDEA